jgi:hypothetical protein
MKKTSLAIALFVLVGGFGVAHAFSIKETVANLFWDSDKAPKITDGTEQNETLPDDFQIMLDQTIWDKEPWEILLDAGINKNRLKGNKLHILNGKPLSAFAYHPSGFIVATSDPKVTTVHINQVTKFKGDSLEALIIFKANKKVVEPRTRDIGFYDFGYNRISFNKGKRQVASNTNVMLLLDRSYSMKGYLGEATKALKTFAKNLGSGITCSIQSFNTTLQDMGPQGLECNKVWDQLTKPVASGGSSIFTMLLKAYETAISQKKNGQKSIVIILTDGGAGDVGLKPKVIEARKKADAPTFIYWIGPVDKTSMTNVANYELTGKNHISKELANYFSSINTFIKGQMAFRMKTPHKKVDGFAQLTNK